MKVYVSSTQADLAPYRAAVMAAVRGLGHEPVSMEYYYHPEDAIPAEKCCADVAGCDAYLVSSPGATASCLVVTIARSRNSSIALPSSGLFPP